MKIAFASNHAGVEEKERVNRCLTNRVFNLKMKDDK